MTTRRLQRIYRELVIKYNILFRFITRTVARCLQPNTYLKPIWLTQTSVRKIMHFKFVTHIWILILNSENYIQQSNNSYFIPIIRHYLNLILSSSESI